MKQFFQVRAVLLSFSFRWCRKFPSLGQGMERWNGCVMWRYVVNWYWSILVCSAEIITALNRKIFIEWQNHVSLQMFPPQLHLLVQLNLQLPTQAVNCCIVDFLSNWQYQTIQLYVNLCSIFHVDKVCKPRSRTELCHNVKHRETCLITEDSRENHGPCGWCGDKCGNANVCESHAYLYENGIADYDNCHESGNEHRDGFFNT